MKFSNIRFDLAGAGLSVAKGSACQIEAPVMIAVNAFVPNYDKKSVPELQGWRNWHSCY